MEMKGKHSVSLKKAAARRKNCAARRLINGLLYNTAYKKGGNAPPFVYLLKECDKFAQGEGNGDVFGKRQPDPAHGERGRYVDFEEFAAFEFL